jgi:hypothetical protein
MLKTFQYTKTMLETFLKKTTQFRYLGVKMQKKRLKNKVFAIKHVEILCAELYSADFLCEFSTSEKCILNKVKEDRNHFELKFCGLLLERMLII